MMLARLVHIAKHLKLVVDAIQGALCSVGSRGRRPRKTGFNCLQGGLNCFRCKKIGMGIRALTVISTEIEICASITIIP